MHLLTGPLTKVVLQRALVCLVGNTRLFVQASGHRVFHERIRNASRIVPAHTDSPSRAKCTATARPMPESPPVIRHTLPASFPLPCNGYGRLEEDGKQHQMAAHVKQSQWAKRRRWTRPWLTLVNKVKALVKTPAL